MSLVPYFVTYISFVNTIESVPLPPLSCEAAVPPAPIVTALDPGFKIIFCQPGNEDLIPPAPPPPPPAVPEPLYPPPAPPPAITK